MIHVVNPEFFAFKVESHQNGPGDFSNLINIFADPKDFELPQYRKTPFMSTVTHDTISYKELPEGFIIDQLARDEHRQYSLYADVEYDQLTENFDNTNHYHSLIFNNCAGHTGKHIMIAAIPCTGLVQPIQKSPYFKLYNASLIVMNQRPFKWKNHFYNKLVYVLVDMTSQFSFCELINTDSEYDIRRMIRHNFGLEFEYKSSDEIDNEPVYFEIKYDPFTTYLPCQDSEERRDLFSYTKKSMFYLSDIPSRIKSSGDSLTVSL